MTTKLMALPDDKAVKARLLELIEAGVVTARPDGSGGIIYSSTVDMSPALLAQALTADQVRRFHAAGQRSRKEM